MKLGHPSSRKLRRWLDGNQPSIDKHLATCGHCASRIEEFSTDSEALIGAALEQLLQIPEELPERLQRTIDKRMSTRADLTLVSELFGVPIRAVRVLSAPSEGDSQ